MERKNSDNVTSHTLDTEFSHKNKLRYYMAHFLSTLNSYERLNISRHPEKSGDI